MMNYTTQVAVWFQLVTETTEYHPLHNSNWFESSFSFFSLLRLPHVTPCCGSGLLLLRGLCSSFILHFYCSLHPDCCGPWCFDSCSPVAPHFFLNFSRHRFAVLWPLAAKPGRSFHCMTPKPPEFKVAPILFNEVAYPAHVPKQFLTSALIN